MKFLIKIYFKSVIIILDILKYVFLQGYTKLFFIKFCFFCSTYSSGLIDNIQRKMPRQCSKQLRNQKPGSCGNVDICERNCRQHFKGGNNTVGVCTTSTKICMCAMLHCPKVPRAPKV